MTGPRILLIDDDPEDRALAALVLSSELPEARVQEIGNAAEFARALSTGRIDLIITDCELGWSDGLSVLEAVRESRPGIPVIALTAQRDPELAVDGMKAGFADFLIKSSKSFLRLSKAAAEALEKADNIRLAARSEPWLGTLLDRANVGVFRSTLDERLIESTPALLRLLGVDSARDLLEMDLPAPYFRAEKRDVLLERLSEEGELQSREVEVKRADGSPLWLNLTEVLLLDVEGEIVIDVLVQDITHLKERQEELRRKITELERSNADLSQFASVASHQLQEPLRAVEKYGELLIEDYQRKLGPEGRELLEHLLDGAHRMEQLIDDLLALSRIDSEGKTFQACDINTTVERAIGNLRTAIEESGAEIRRRGLPTVLGDLGQLVQLWQNLLANAVRFRGKEVPRVEVSAERQRDDWIFSVRDNGTGFDPDEAKNVFNIFRRLHPDLPGTGIGLTICRRIVERHGGRIWAESKPGKGSTFYFTIPIGGEGQETREQAVKRLQGPAR
ncbi:MAG: ATP-binding protein [Thermoanaerobaculia bacterium]